MEIQLLPIAMAAVFVAGGIAIQAFAKWADKVGDVLGTIFVMMAMVVVLALMVRHSPPPVANGAAMPASSATAMYGGLSPGIHTTFFRKTGPATPSP
jgi:hypothetical protein